MEMIMRSYPNDWVSNSMMYKHGVAKAPTGKLHTLSAKVQGVYNYTIGPYSNPVLEVEPGDTIIAETQDAFEGKIRSESDKPSKVWTHYGQGGAARRYDLYPHRENGTTWRPTPRYLLYDS